MLPLSISGVVLPVAQSGVRPVKSSATRNSTSPTASTGASTRSTIIATFCSAPMMTVRSRRMPIAPPRAAPASSASNQCFLSSSRSRPIFTSQNISESMTTTRNVMPVKASAAPISSASTQIVRCTSP